MRQIGIDKFGHQKKIIKYAQQLNQSPQQSQQYQQQQQAMLAAQATYAPMMKNEIEGTNVYDTAGQ